MKIEHQDQLNQEVNQALEQQVSNMNELTAAKLRAMRLKALEQKPLSWQQKLQQIVLAPKGLASACAAAFVLVLLVNGPEQTERTLSVEDLTAYMNPVLTEDPEMLSELEFLAWLEHEQLLEVGKQS